MSTHPKFLVDQMVQVKETVPEHGGQIGQVVDYDATDADLPYKVYLDLAWASFWFAEDDLIKVGKRPPTGE